MKNKAHYILDLFSHIYRLDWDSYKISYGIDHLSKVQIARGNTQNLEQSLPFAPAPDNITWKTWKGTKIPFFFDSKDGDLIERNGDQVIIKMDIIASAFYLLSGWHEYFDKSRDHFGRFPYQKSLQYQMNIISIPVVNYYFDILRTAVEEAYLCKIPDPLWRGKKYALCLTHDIDTCESGWLEGGFHALKQRNLVAPFSLLFRKIFYRDAWFNFEEILKIENGFQATSTFFFLVNSKREHGIKNADYNFKKKKFLKVQNQIQSAGSEVGIHGSAGCSENLEKFVSELESFPYSLSGNRFHFLLYQPDKTGQIIEKAKLLYDSTLGFAECPGFRNSFCFPFHPYNIADDRPYGFLEIPLVVMDGSLQKYMKADPSGVDSIIGPLLEEVKKFSGVLTLLWHNTHFSEYKYNGWKRVYLDILTSCHEEASLLSCADIIKVYK